MSSDLVPMAKIAIADRKDLERALDRITAASSQSEASLLVIQCLLTDAEYTSSMPMEAVRIEWGVPIDLLLAPAAAAEALSGLKVPLGPDGVSYIAVRFLLPSLEGGLELWAEAHLLLDERGLRGIRNSHTGHVAYSRED